MMRFPSLISQEKLSQPLQLNSRACRSWGKRLLRIRAILMPFSGDQVLSLQHHSHRTYWTYDQ